MAARCHVQRIANGWTIDRERDVPETAKLARRAVPLGKEDATALSNGGLHWPMSSMNLMTVPPSLIGLSRSIRIWPWHGTTAD